MSSLRYFTAKQMEDSNFAEAQRSGFQRRIYSQKRWGIPRRYVIAIMLFFVLMIQIWRIQNIMLMLVSTVVLEDAHELFPSVTNWTLEDINYYGESLWIGEACAQMPAALLIFISSSHKFLSASVVLSSVLHMLTPTAWMYHSWTFMLVLFLQGIALAPTRIAVFTMWKDWAPSSERTKLLMFSFSGSYIFLAFPSLHYEVMSFINTRDSFYLSGACGLVWSLFWYVAIFDTPNNDPLISEREHVYLQNRIPSTSEETANLLKVPWKKILTSKPVWALSFIYLKVACSLNVFMVVILLYSSGILTSDIDTTHIFISFVVVFILILLLVAILGNYISYKFRGKISSVRKGFLCGGFVLHAVFLLGTIFNDSVVKLIFWFISYMMFAISIPGFITNALDLSSRYIAIVAGIVESFFYLGQLCSHFFMDYIIQSDVASFEWLFLFDGLLAFCAAVVFFVWGSAEEQTWSMTFSTARGSTDYQRYPSPEDEDDTNLVSERL